MAYFEGGLPLIYSKFSSKLNHYGSIIYYFIEKSKNNRVKVSVSLSGSLIFYFKKENVKSVLAYTFLLDLSNYFWIVREIKYGARWIIVNLKEA